MSEDTSDVMASIVNLCEIDPDAGLELIDETISDKPELSSDPFVKFAKAIAFGSKGLFQVMRDNPQIKILDLTGTELKLNLGITDIHLDYLVKALQNIKEMEQIYPGALKLFGTEQDRQGERKVDVIASALERCRPGSVQEILGKTKLVYFGRERIGVRSSCHFSQQEWDIFCDIFFTSERIAKSADLALDGKMKDGRRYIVVMLNTSLDFHARPSAEFPVAGFVCLYSDGTFSQGSQYTSNTLKL